MSLLSNSEIRELIQHQDGKQVSLFMPTHRKGKEIQQDPIMLKNLLGQAEETLVLQDMRRAEAGELLKPAHELVLRHEFWRHQSDGLALYISPEIIRAFRLPLSFEELVVVGERFHIKPLLPMISGDGRFYILALSQNEIRLLQGTRYSVAQVDVSEIPESLAEVLQWDDPEKRLQWHTRTQASLGGRAAVFHGHGVASADDPKDSILRYFHKVDKGLSRVLSDGTAPLVTAGVEYLHPLYREANSYPHLLKEGIGGNPEEMSVEELHQQAWELVSPLFQREKQEQAGQYQQLAGSDSDLASNQLEAVVPAAHHGRVATLFVGKGVHRWGTFDPETREVRVHDDVQAGDADLLDLAAVHTVLNRGAVYVLEPGELPEASPVAAILRY
jgi:hypothetical protein